MSEVREKRRADKGIKRRNRRRLRFEAEREVKNNFLKLYVRGGLAAILSPYDVEERAISRLVVS